MAENMIDVDNVEAYQGLKKRRTNVTHRRPQAPKVKYRHVSPVHVRQSTQRRAQSFAASMFDMDELERVAVKTLFLCVQLCNYDNVIIKISKRTTAKQVITRLRAYPEVKKLYEKAKPLELILSVCLTLQIQCAALPNYFEIHRLHMMGFWTMPDQYTHFPLLTLRARDSTQPREKVFQLPEVLQCTRDSLVHGGKAPNWSSNSGEAIAFRLKHPFTSQETELQGFTRYPEFFDKRRDPVIEKQRVHQINVRVPFGALGDVSLSVTRTTTVREALSRLCEKLQSQGVTIDFHTTMLKVVGSCEYIWTWDVPLLQADGVREAIRSHQTPLLVLKPRPADLQSAGKLPSFAVYDVVVPLVRNTVDAILDNLDMTCFPVNDLDLDDEENLGRVIRARTTATHADLPDYVAKRMTVFKGSIFIPGPTAVASATRKVTATHKGTICFTSVDAPAPTPTELPFIDVRKLHKPFRVRIRGIDNLRMYTYDKESMTPLLRLNPDRIRVEVRLFAGSVQLESSSHSTTISHSSKDASGVFIGSVRWDEWVKFAVRYSELPQASSLKFTIYCHVSKKASKSPSEKLLGWVNFRLFDYANRLETGVRRIGLYPYYSVQDRTGSTTPNNDPRASQLFIQLESFLKPVAFGETSDSVFNVDAYISDLTAPVPDRDKREILRIAEEHPLYSPSEVEKALLWRYRAFTSSVPKGLPKLLQSLNWCDPQCVRDIHYILQFCNPQSPLVGLELLDGKFADVKVRDYAVKCLDAMSTYETQQYLIQLVQALKFEPYHDSALAKFLMKRALRHPMTIGHTMFWLLRSEMEEPYFQERFGLMLEQFVRKSGGVRNSLVFEDHFLRNLENIAKTIQKSSTVESYEDLTDFLQSELRVVNDEMPEFYPLAINPKFVAKRIKTEECKFMKSKKKPIYLVFENLEEEDGDIHILFKYGDDLRQDMLVLQTMRIMNSLWTAEDLILKLSLYRCLTLGMGEGMLEIVRGAKTLADVHKWGGGKIAVYNDKNTLAWLETHSTGGDYIDNFLRSCAGYSVGMFVLGVGDRHSDNIMMKFSGEIFHIDFGHFLGYFKKKYGVKRETAPFVFTPDFRYVMGGKKSEGYKRFKQLAVEAYNILRANRRLLITLFCLMLCSGIPELTRKDLEFLLNTLPPEVPEKKAGSVFLTALKAALKSPMTRLNWVIHLLAS